MRSQATLVFVSILMSAAVWAQAPVQATGSAQTTVQSSAQAAAGKPHAGLASGTRMNAVLQSKLDTRHAKVGDRVRAETTSAVQENGRTVIPKHSKLIGHVAEVSSATKGHAGSSLGVVFDQAVTPKGQTIPLHAAIANLTTASSVAAMNDDAAGLGGMEAGPMMAPMPAGVGVRGGGGLLAGGGGMIGGAVGAGGELAGAAPGVAGGAAGGSRSGLAAGSGLLRASNGTAFQLAPMPTAGTQGDLGSGTLLSSQHGNMQFNSGTHLQLEEQAPGASASATSHSTGAARIGH